MKSKKVCVVKHIKIKSQSLVVAQVTTLKKWLRSNDENQPFSFEAMTEALSQLREICNGFNIDVDHIAKQPRQTFICYESEWQKVFGNKSDFALYCDIQKQLEKKSFPAMV